MGYSWLKKNVIFHIVPLQFFFIIFWSQIFSRTNFSCMYVSCNVLRILRCATYLVMCCVSSDVLRIFWCAAYLLMCCISSDVLRIFWCAAYLLMCCVSSDVLRIFWCAAYLVMCYVSCDVPRIFTEKKIESHGAKNVHISDFKLHMWLDATHLVISVATSHT